MIDGNLFFDQSVKHDSRTYDNIRKLATDQGDKYTIRCLQDLPYFKKYYMSIAIDLSKQQKIDVDSKGILQINITGNLEEDNATTFSIIEEAKETVSQFSKGILKYRNFILFQYNINIKWLNITL